MLVSLYAVFATLPIYPDLGPAESQACLPGLCYFYASGYSLISASYMQTRRRDGIIVACSQTFTIVHLFEQHICSVSNGFWKVNPGGHVTDLIEGIVENSVEYLT